MTQTVPTAPRPRVSGARATSVHTSGPASEVVATLSDRLAAQAPAAVWFFASSDLEAADLAAPLAAALPGAVVTGCSTAGEFTESAGGTGGVSAFALPAAHVLRAEPALVDLAAGVREGVEAAVARLETAVGPLRDLDPTRWVGVLLVDGMHGAEEAVSAALGNAAPLLHVVGGSAGDDLKFESTWVSVGEQVSTRGASLVLLELAVPFAVVRTASFRELGRSVTVTRADAATRTVWELDGRPAVEAYADAVGCEVDEVGSEQFMRHPLGLMMDGKPFVRSPQQVVDGGGIVFYCEVLEGMSVEVLDATDIVSETRLALEATRAELGGEVSGALLFNCILRRLDLDAQHAHESFRDVFADIPAAGFHTYGETWMGHMNQTLTGLVLG
ncbi:FIST signal transduction protein [Nocardioides bruguierae]|uniref:FIST signal transduction protein n=1 Tax=Nocardioides bruguierae TaxID=2945102 RepID=UPI00202281AD|nr:FIST N-terminal domain-containing protein [Nocardioides bruguierae]MCL8027019.1 FIST C-terminal domain-containing protein [Nocardioides bruguierae]